MLTTPANFFPNLPPWFTGIKMPRRYSFGSALGAYRNRQIRKAIRHTGKTGTEREMPTWKETKWWFIGIGIFGLVWLAIRLAQ